jgi:hypothetical protein
MLFYLRQVEPGARKGRHYISCYQMNLDALLLYLLLYVVLGGYVKDFLWEIYVLGEQRATIKALPSPRHPLSPLREGVFMLKDGGTFCVEK